MKRDDPNYAGSLISTRWDLIGKLKDRSRRDRRRDGLAAILARMEQLNRHAHALNRSWPSERDREEDFETHLRVAQALVQTPRPVAARGARSRGRRIR